MVFWGVGGCGEVHVIYDARWIARQFSGLGRFTGELFLELVDLDSDTPMQFTVLVWGDDPFLEENPYWIAFKALEEEGRIVIVYVPFEPLNVCQHFRLSKYVNSIDADVYFYTHFDLPLGVRVPSVAVVHDLFPLKVPGYIVRKPWLKKIYFRLMLRIMVRRAAYIFTVSATTREDLIAEVGAKFQKKIGVSYEGSTLTNKKGNFKEKEILELPPNYLMYVGDRRPHKNLRRIIDLFIMLRQSENYAGSLLLVGTLTNHDFDVDEYIMGRPDINVMGQVPDRTLLTLYERMDAMLFLSKYEGFGLPVVEAGLLGKKMIVSDGGSLTEISPPWAYVLPNSAPLETELPNVARYLSNSISVVKNYGEKYTWKSAARSVHRGLSQFAMPKS